MEDDPEIVDRMIDYLYRLDFDDQPSSANNKALEGRLVINARVYAIAEKYELCSLKDVAKEKTVAALGDEWNTESFLMALEIAWTTTPISDRALRDCFIPVIGQHKDDLHKKEGFLEVMRANGDLAVDVVEDCWGKAKVPNPAIMYCSRCQYYHGVKCCGCGQTNTLQRAK